MTTLAERLYNLEMQMGRYTSHLESERETRRRTNQHFDDEVKALHQKIDTRVDELRDKIDEKCQDLDTKVDEKVSGLSEKMDGCFRESNGKVSELQKFMHMALGALVCMQIALAALMVVFKVLEKH